MPRKRQNERLRASCASRVSRPRLRLCVSSTLARDFFVGQPLLGIQLGFYFRMWNGYQPTHKVREFAKVTRLILGEAIG